MAASSQKKQFEPYHSHPSICDRNCPKLRPTLCEKETTFVISPAFVDKADMTRTYRNVDIQLSLSNVRFWG
jgi:hypothetical protein